MKQLTTKKIAIWIILTINTLFSFLVGLTTAFLNNIFGLFLTIITIPLTILIIYLVFQLFIRNGFNTLNPLKKITSLLMLSVNLLFVFSIGFSIPFMESEGRYNFALVMLPLLLILNFIIFDRIQYYIKHRDSEGILSKEKLEERKKRPVIEFEGKKYIFSIRSIIIIAIGAPLLAWITYLFFDWEPNYWLHEMVVKQTVFCLNLFFNMGAEAVYSPVGKYFWRFSIPGRSSIYFETFCTGIQAINVFVGIIVLTPHSKDPTTNEDTIWRKTKSLIVSSVIFYVVNIIRMIIQIGLYYIGYAWDDIHVSISAASSFVAAIIVLLMHKWIPEFIISIIYTGTLVNEKIKELRGKKSEIESPELAESKETAKDVRI